MPAVKLRTRTAKLTPQLGRLFVLFSLSTRTPSETGAATWCCVSTCPALWSSSLGFSCPVQVDQCQGPKTLFVNLNWPFSLLQKLRPSLLVVRHCSIGSSHHLSCGVVSTFIFQFNRCSRKTFYTLATEDVFVSCALALELCCTRLTLANTRRWAMRGTWCLLPPMMWHQQLALMTFACLQQEMPMQRRAIPSSISDFTIGFETRNNSFADG